MIYYNCYALQVNCLKVGQYVRCVWQFHRHVLKFGFWSESPLSWQDTQIPCIALLTRRRVCSSAATERIDMANQRNTSPVVDFAVGWVRRCCLCFAIATIQSAQRYSQRNDTVSATIQSAQPSIAAVKASSLLLCQLKAMNYCGSVARWLIYLVVSRARQLKTKILL